MSDMTRCQEPPWLEQPALSGTPTAHRAPPRTGLWCARRDLNPHVPKDTGT
jgi:hypothetical protein